MTHHILFKIKSADLNRAKKFLVPLADAPFYQIEEENDIFLGGFFHRIPKAFPEFLANFEILDNSIDWTKQWTDFSPHMNGEFMELNLEEFGFNSVIKLKPGPGFGDLSHPTTKMCLIHLARLAKNKNIIDVGSGSGILSLAAFAFGAKKVFSLEIDKPSILHTKENLKLNRFSSEFVFEFLPKNLKIKTAICIVNMTFAEQKIALNNLSGLPKHSEFLTSGILLSQKKEYLKWAQSKNLKLKQIDSLDKWGVFFGNLIESDIVK